jgi:uncharacterized protein DUF2795
MQEIQESRIAGEFLRTLDYPIAKADLVRAARESKLADPICQTFEKLPDRDYEDAEDVTGALNAAS